MSTELVPQDTCTHPEVRIYYGPYDRAESVLECSACQKKIAIPLETIFEGDVKEIVHITFGAAWADKLFP